MKAELYLDGSQVATIEAPPYQWEYDGGDERLESVLVAAEDLSDWETTGIRASSQNPTSGPETEVEGTPEQQFNTAVEMARELGYYVAGGR